MTPAQRRSAAARKAARSRKRMAEARGHQPAPAAKRTTKVDRIEQLLRAGALSRAEIAKVVGCKPDYVRAVYQRKIVGSDAGKRYRDKMRQDPTWVDNYRRMRREQFRHRYHTDPEFRERQLASVRECARRRRAAAHA